MESSDTALEGTSYYHGVLTANDIVSLMTEIGDFLVRARVAPTSQLPLLILSVRSSPTELVHKLIQRQTPGWTINGVNFYVSVASLIKHYLEQHIPVEGVTLKRALVRPKFLIHSGHIEYEKKLGAGEFGDVWLGSIDARDLGIKNKDREKVALKMCKSGADQAREMMMNEARIAFGYKHTNVIRCFGVANDVPPIMIVLEFCEVGALDSHLHQKRATGQKVSDMRRINWCRQIARAMAYLWGEHRVVHRDLAARNILLDHHFRAKVADFGLSRHAGKDKNYAYTLVDSQRRLPLRWMAPETLHFKDGVPFTTSTDVYSYAILVWEIENYAAVPWENMDSREMVYKVRHGERPPIPESTPKCLRETMTRCWSSKPLTRPSFEVIARNLDTYARQFAFEMISQRTQVNSNSQPKSVSALE